MTPTAFAVDELPSLGFANVASVTNGSISEIKTSPDILVKGGVKVSSAVGSSFNTKASIFQDDSVTISARFDLPEGNAHLGKVAQMLTVGFYSPASDGAVCSGKNNGSGSYYQLVNTLKNHTVQEQSDWYSGWANNSTLRSRDFVDWNGSFNNLTPFRKDTVLQDKVVLQKQNVIEMMTDSKFPPKLDGVLCLTFGYKVDVGGKTELVFNQTSVDVSFAKGERANVKDLPLAFSSTPTLNQPVQISLSDADTVKYENTQWRLLQQPATSSAVLQASGNTASVTPTVAGEYVVEVTTTVNGQAAVSTQNFIVSQVFVYSADKIDNPSGKPLDETVVRVKNQLWVASSSLDEQGLRELIAQQQFNAVFQVKGYDSTLKLLLVEFDDASPNAAAKVEELRLAEGVTEVFYRTIEGKNFMKPAKLPPGVTDANAFFTDDNWHLNKINVSEAWDITTGSQDFLIGIIDDGFLGTHQDLQGRFARIIGNDNFGTLKQESTKEYFNLTDEQEKKLTEEQKMTKMTTVDIIGDHGTKITGVIAANANQLGTTGINWQTKVVAGTGFFGDIISNPKVLVVNMSLGNHLSDIFNPDDEQKSTKVYEELVLNRLLWRNNLPLENKLFIFSAGNGVGNGNSKNGIYGVDAKYGNGYLHYSNPKDRIPATIPNRKDTDTFNPLENLLVVGALTREGYLEHYSNFGESVEIAAPTNFSSTAAGKAEKICNPYTGFCSREAVLKPLSNSSETGNANGTSTAAPVVTGVASLVYSVNPNLSAATVKQILINSASATEKVCIRYTNKEHTQTEDLTKRPVPSPCIPIVNAANAVKMAQSLSLKAQASVADPFKAEAVVTFKPQFSSYQLANLKVTGLEAYTADGKSGNVIPAVRIEGNQAIISLKTSLPVYKLKVSATLTDTQGKSIEAASEYAFAVDHVTVQANETGTNLPVGSAQIVLDSGNGKYSGVTDENGKVDVWFMDKPLVDLAMLATQQTIVGALEQLTKNSLGLSYKFIGKKAGYKTVATLLSMSTGYENSVALTMDKLVTEPIKTEVSITTISGENSSSLGGVAVEIKQGTTVVPLLTNDNGQVTVSLVQGSYTVNLSKNGYQAQKDVVLEVKGSKQSQPYTLKLQPQDLLNFEALVQKNGSGAMDETVCLWSSEGEIACKKVDTLTGIVSFGNVPFKANTNYWIQLSSDAAKQSEKFTTGTLFAQLNSQQKLGVLLEIKWSTTADVIYNTDKKFPIEDKHFFAPLTITFNITVKEKGTGSPVIPKKVCPTIDSSELTGECITGSDITSNVITIRDIPYSSNSSYTAIVWVGNDIRYETISTAYAQLPAQPVELAVEVVTVKTTTTLPFAIDSRGYILIGQ